MASRGAKNFYQVLDVDETADRTIIQKSYRKLALRLHPDRASTPAEAEAFTAQFVLLAEAYRTLSDSKLRGLYDACLKNREAWERSPPTINEVIDLGDMVELFENEQYVYSYSCRCGQHYEITELELEQGLDVVACPGCSLYIRVTFQQAD